MFSVDWFRYIAVDRMCPALHTSWDGIQAQCDPVLGKQLWKIDGCIYTAFRFCPFNPHQFQSSLMVYKEYYSDMPNPYQVRGQLTAHGNISRCK